jgi:hypothetical protein
MKLTVGMELECRPDETVAQMKERSANAFDGAAPDNEMLDQLANRLIETCRATGHIQEGRVPMGDDATLVMTVTP